jgi:hypothetical protein
MQWISKSILLEKQASKPQVKFREGFNLLDHFRVYRSGENMMAEFLSTGTFPDEWFNRQRYEVEAGRQEEPILYDSLYQTVQDAGLPRNVTIYQMREGGLIFEQIQEGGEVKMGTLNSGSKSVSLMHLGLGIEYTEDLFLFNEYVNLPLIERWAGIAYSAMLNHYHFAPFLNYTYTSANQTAATDVVYSSKEELPARYLRLLEKAVVNATEDTTNPRRGPYTLLISQSDVFNVHRALTAVAQQGITLQGDVLSMIDRVIVYNGWASQRGKLVRNYPGVTAGKAYLIDMSMRMSDFQSWVKLPLREQRGDGDMSRFVIDKVIWDTYFGVYANIAATTEEITWPTLATATANS